MNKIFNIIKNLIKDNNLDQYLTKKYFDYGIVACAILLGFYLKWDVQNILAFSFFIWIILNPISSRLLAQIVFYLLSFIPLLLIIDRDVRAEQIAILAYYFLIFTVIMAVTEFKQKKRNEKNNW